MSLPPAPPPTSALPDTPTITHAMKIVDHGSMSFDLALPSPSLDSPIMSPFGPDDREERAGKTNLSSTRTPRGVPTPDDDDGSSPVTASSSTKSVAKAFRLAWCGEGERGIGSTFHIFDFINPDPSGVGKL
ncbi:hypothetical protein FRC04_003928 [Tulasnella sp. 424]|nr:hypothetical protein FRC04_003928 [Tulasnella sp. 424]